MPKNPLITLNRPRRIEEALTLASQADKVVVALGETDWMSGEAASRSDIRLPENN